jgi:hypothetical protein
MKLLYWDVQNNVLLFVKVCKECKGFAWYAMGERTGGIWEELGCRDTAPQEDEFVEIELNY